MHAINTGVLLILLGFIAVLAGTLTDASVEAGGVLLIGPIPVIFGTTPIITLGAALAGVIMMLLYVFIARQRP